ncbi:MAG: TetR/AcrR family transcriptional regulator [Myxococcota bacterium]
MRKTGRRTPKQDRAHATVDAVIEAAARVLVEDGYDRLTTNRVAERAGVSIGTLYQYFPNKDEIVQALVHRIADERIAAFGASLSGLADSGIGVHDGIRTLLDGVLAAMRIRPELSRRLLLEAPRERRFDLERAWTIRVIELVRATLYRRSDRVRAGQPDLMAYVAVTGTFAVLQDAAAYRPELLEGDALRDELAVLAARYFEP